jgi:hypothetical protein
MKSFAIAHVLPELRQVSSALARVAIFEVAADCPDLSSRSILSVLTFGETPDLKELRGKLSERDCRSKAYFVPSGESAMMCFRHGSIQHYAGEDAAATSAKKARYARSVFDDGPLVLAQKTFL